MEILPLLSCAMLVFAVLRLVSDELRRRQLSRCYLLDYTCHKPADDRKVTTATSAQIVTRNRRIGLPEFKFLLQMIVSSGIGENTYAPYNILEGREENPSHDDALAEMEECWRESLDKLFARTGVLPRDIDVLVLNVSMFFPTPSLTSQIVHHYKMREDVTTYNLSGMGCSASVIAIGLVQNLFKVRPRAMAIVVTSEAIAPNWYSGSVRSMMLGNCLFRSGGASILLTNDPALKQHAKMELKCLVRVHLGADDTAYKCADWCEDDDGYRGVKLEKTLPKVAVKALTQNLMKMTPKILPSSELGRYAVLRLLYRAAPRNWGIAKPSINMKSGVNHFIIHAGGTAVIKGIGESLGLTQYDIEPAMMTLHRWGNTSSSTLWYELCYMEAKKRLQKGDRVLMLGLGGGFKCNSCLWQVKRDGIGDAGAWADCIDGYPPETLENPFSHLFGWINDADDITFKKALEYYLETGKIVVPKNPKEPFENWVLP